MKKNQNSAVTNIKDRMVKKFGQLQNGEEGGEKGHSKKNGSVEASKAKAIANVSRVKSREELGAEMFTLIQSVM